MGLGERIKEARGDLTQRDLADRLGVDPMTVSRWEREITPVSTRRIRQIAEITGRAAEWFYEAEAAA